MFHFVQLVKILRGYTLHYYTDAVDWGQQSFKIVSLISIGPNISIALFQVL